MKDSRGNDEEYAYWFRGRKEKLKLLKMLEMMKKYMVKLIIYFKTEAVDNTEKPFI